MPGSILGTEVRRVEDPDLVRGLGTFVDNLAAARSDVLHAVFVRSPMAHARLLSVDTAPAADAPGVVAVLAAADLGDRPVPLFASANDRVPRFPLARDVVRYVGDPVALVVARTRAEAVDAAELVDVDYDPLPAVVDPEAAADPGAPQLHPELRRNVAILRLDDGDPLDDAQVVVRARIENNRLATAPIEGNAVLADPTGDDAGHRLTVWLSTQHPHLGKSLLARFTGIDKAQIRVVAPHVGGAFGGKAGISPDHAAVVAAALRLGRPVAWAETRSEAMLSMHGRGQVQYVELGLTRDGRITGMRARVLGDCGAYAGFGGSFASGSTRTMAQGPYVIPRIRYEGASVVTTTSPVGAFRGAGRPEAAAMLERVLDLAADELGIAPEEIRRRNFVRPEQFPWGTFAGRTYDSGDYDLPLTEALRHADVEGARAEQARRRESGDPRQLGIGIASYVEITGFGGSEHGFVSVHADGTATVRAGTSAHGQGHATAFSMIVADRLGLALDRIGYEQSDTAVVPTGGGTGGARSLQMGGLAVAKAAAEVRDRARLLAAELLEASVDDVEVGAGGLEVAGVPDARISWADLAREASERGEPLEVGTTFEQQHPTFPFGSHVAVVEVDTETGLVRPLRHVAVDDCGRVVNPLLVAGQQHGGALQGISQALWEEFVYDVDGVPLTSTLADYSMPTAADATAIEAHSTETPTPYNELGVKGIGEAATIGATPAVQNAVVDALSHLGVGHVDIPCTPTRVFGAIRDAAAGAGDPWREPPGVFSDPSLAEDEAPDDVEV
ncbi:xanthine dehydrogenase family protein molybdopterin-binding subunit [Nocardioides euryhalodurans]|uniref:Xanthine dehydrogenase family protein molybdopterin-binding subunit n=1 Tax=Nocardioides euryhalodurans TaxID=2518370 RepID=A0A4P7GGR9_9ACTN|nr:xanthine dehydrogenase family protein molybdopterin-binding subunit [Nocardioides euryhalodurans]QBR91058.1 xanthine dehydrogenase family protein molybdopterin-binding subunit [Nocardioides euryhalodurans]